MMCLLRSHRIFLVLLLSLTALLTIGLDRVSRGGHNRRELNPGIPEFVAEHLTATRFDQNGRLKEQLTAARMWQYPGKPDVFFDYPQLSIYDNGILNILLQGDIGRYSDNTKQAFFERRAVMRRPALQGKPETRIVTQAMCVDTNQRVVRSADPSVLYYGQSTANSAGFEYQDSVGMLNLFAKTKIIYAK